MANRQKTISYAWPSLTTLQANATTISLGSQTIYIPENSAGTPVTFRSAIVEVQFRDAITATGGTIGETRIGLTLAGATQALWTEGDDLVNTGEQIGGAVGPVDFTAHFTSNFGTGTSKALAIEAYFNQTSGTTLGMINVAATLHLTYDYDDTATTHIKTVRIPLESSTASLATSKTEIGTNQIPALDTFLPETSKVIRDWFIVVEGMEGNQGATDAAVSMEIDSLGATAFGNWGHALTSEPHAILILSKTSAIPDTSTTHAFYMWANLANTYACAAITLYVTYEFDPTSTTILNSILLPMEFQSPMGGTTSTNSHRFQRTISVVEPDTITLKQSAVRLNWNTAASSTVAIRGGSQSYRSYATVGSMQVGMLSLQHRLDSGSAQGAGMTLARGLNTITIDAYRSAGSVSNASGYIILNYTSGRHANGVGVHAHTVFQHMRDVNFAASGDLSVTFAPVIPETYYWILGAGIEEDYFLSAAASTYNIFARLAAGEGSGSGWLSMYTDPYIGDADITFGRLVARMRADINRWASDPDPERINLFTSRLWRFTSITTCRFGAFMVLTYHAMTWQVTGVVSGYVDADGAGLTVKFYCPDTGCYLGERTTTAGGAFSFTWYDDYTNIRAVCEEDSTHVGASAAGTA